MTSKNSPLTHTFPNAPWELEYRRKNGLGLRRRNETSLGHTQLGVLFEASTMYHHPHYQWNKGKSSCQFLPVGASPVLPSPATTNGFTCPATAEFNFNQNIFFKVIIYSFLLTISFSTFPTSWHYQHHRIWPGLRGAMVQHNLDILRRWIKGKLTLTSFSVLQPRLQSSAPSTLSVFVLMIH